MPLPATPHNIRQAYLRKKAELQRFHKAAYISYREVGRLVAAEFNTTILVVEEMVLRDKPNWPFLPESEGGGGFNPQQDRDFKQTVDLSTSTIRQLVKLTYEHMKKESANKDREITLTEVRYTVAAQLGVKEDDIRKALDDRASIWAYSVGFPKPKTIRDLEQRTSLTHPVPPLPLDPLMVYKDAQDILRERQQRYDDFNARHQLNTRFNPHHPVQIKRLLTTLLKRYRTSIVDIHDALKEGERLAKAEKDSSRGR